MRTTPPPPPVVDPPRREATVRALVVGCALGALLAAGNVYTGLKIGFLDSCSIAAALLGFLVFSGVKNTARRYTRLENNITQTVAGSAAVMVLALGLPGPVAALGLMGTTPPGWAIAAWGLGAGLLGIAAGVILRKKLIVEDALPFPTGRATGEVIETIHATRATAMRRAWLLAGAAAVAMAVTWFRDGTPKLVPQATAFGGTILGLATASLTIGMSWSPLLGSVGAMIGLRGATSILLGAGIGWGVLAPRVLNAGIIHKAEYADLSSWLVWPALGLLTAGSFVPLLLDVGALRRAFRDLAGLVRRETGRPGPNAATPTVGPRALGGVVLLSAIALVVVGKVAFGFGTGATLAAIVVALVLTNVAGRATGETDVAPVGPMGQLTQVVFAGAGQLTSLLNGSAAIGASTQASQLLYSFRAGERLGASPRAQIGAQILGAMLGAVVVVPVYFLLVRTYGIGTAALPAASAQSFKAVAEAVAGNAAELPRYGPLAGAIGLAVGIVLAGLARTRVSRFLPSPAAMGMAMLMPASYALAIFAGAVALAIARRLRPGLDDSDVMTLAAGGMAGESLMGVLVAFLSAAGLL
jgi:uncharacterized oligopeptide transporter (OPT) family protein